ncbi:hypothetical protein V9T40_005016 [Parthenolecanium corni]|uniref:Uncharacterized protein n=1 Tax=Parthenolecanium corni TaxID=536013 RepID=A0AAN9TD17_9HEMI
MENANSKDQSFRASKEDVKSDESTKSQPKKSDLAKDKLAGLHFLKQSFRTLSVPKKSLNKPAMEKRESQIYQLSFLTWNELNSGL